MPLNIRGILAAVETRAATLGLFGRVNLHEPKNAPGSGLTAAIWVDSIAPVSEASGLAATTGRVVVKMRIYTTVLQEPQDAIDPAVTDAVDAMLTALSGDFDLGDTVRNVDLLGQHGQALDAQAGYLEQDGAVFRVMDITIPLIINDLWNQG